MKYEISSDAGPRFSCNDEDDRHVVDVKLAGDVLSLRSACDQRANLPHLFCGQPCLRVSLARGRSALSDFICRIVRLGSEKQMGWVDAWWVVALVEHMKFLRDRPDIQGIGNSMRVEDVKGPRACCDSAVSLQLVASPFPTAPKFRSDDRAGFVDLRPEPFSKWHRTSSVTVIPQETKRAPLYPAQSPTRFLRRFSSLTAPALTVSGCDSRWRAIVAGNREHLASPSQKLGVLLRRIRRWLAEFDVPDSITPAREIRYAL